LEQLADTPEVRAATEQEFVAYDPQAIVSLPRRRFLKLMGASMALAGLTLSGCRRWPKEKLAPYTAGDKDRVPGIPEQYATVMELGGVGVGLLVTSFDGRPIKIEGNPSHPFSKVTDNTGAADAIAQASVLELYDPDRKGPVLERTTGQANAVAWERFVELATKHFAGLKDRGGAGLAILSEATSSPSVLDMRKRLLEAMPSAGWYEYEPLGHSANGRVRLHLDKAATVVLFDADLLGTHPAHVRYAADWASRRRLADQGRMNRVYVAESAFTMTGTVADRRLPVRPSRIEALIHALAQKVGITVAAGASLHPDEQTFVDAAAADLLAHKGEAVVCVGDHYSPAAHRLAWMINQHLDAVTKTVDALEEPAGGRSDSTSLQELSKRMAAGQVTTLLILGGNPVYDAPADLDFAKLLGGVPVSIHLSLYDDETSAACKWHVPRAHYLEAWGDARAWDGTISIAQPLIQPLYGGKSIIELLALVTGDALSDGEKIVRRTLGAMVGDDEKRWRRALHDGVVEGTAGRAAPAAATNPTTATMAQAVPSGHGFEVRFLPSAGVHDGRFANNGWLQEMPDPLTKLTWDNAALIAKKDADALGVANGDVVKITVGGRSIEIAAYILPGQPVGVIGLPLGYGRTRSGNVGTGVGTSVYALRTTGAMHWATGATVQKTGQRHLLAMTQDHHLLDAVGARARDQRIGAKGRSADIVRQASLDEYQRDPHFVHRGQHGDLSLQLFDPPGRFNDPHAWGMAIDMNSCIGCSACVIACQAENNVPIVGKDQVAMGREMHWIRVDRYFKGSGDDPAPEVAYQPMTCQHCENAPCEQVCPVAATVHDTEGLNTMVYNRCVGTRYCSNNCPYKVRRFNYFDYHAKDPRGAAKPHVGMPDTQQRTAIDRIKRMVFNPEVTVRMRGVMEKCTYCTQRIKAATSRRRNAREEIRDGDVVTACQQACPTQAIVFGDLNDPNSQVSRLQRNNRSYGVLAQLNTRPRTRYLAKISNPDAKTEDRG
jgi:molybdopterin-containing oxidoreductase family iron-sulfur binding subunit